MQFDDAKVRMKQIKADLQHTVDTIAANTKYTRDAQLQEIAQAILDSRQQAVALRDEFATTSETARRQLSTKLFGIPSGAGGAEVLSHRDAQDRVAKITDPDELDGLLKRATDSGDETLARAIAGHAHRQGWSEVAATYADQTDQADTYAELNALPAGGNFNTAAAVVFSVGVPNLPPELSDTIRAAASQDATRQLQKLAETTPEQTTQSTKVKTYQPGPVGSTVF